MSIELFSNFSQRINILHQICKNPLDINIAKILQIPLILTTILSTIAVALHSPGQMSMDTSMQLYEANIGKSISWQPPFMSALLRWLGGGELATAFIVVICSLFTYMSLGYILTAFLYNRIESGNLKISIPRFFLCLLLLLNPIIFCHIGIVWKDILFSSVITAAIALSFAAAFSLSYYRFLLAILAVIFLAIAMQIRQQGIFMAPILLLLPIIAIIDFKSDSRLFKIFVSILLVITFTITLFSTKTLVNHTIIESGEKSSSVGFNIIMIFDVTGIIARSKNKTNQLPVIISEEQRSAIQHIYTPKRIDSAYDSIYTPIASVWFGTLTNKQLKKTWWSLVRHEPKAFFEHKWYAFLETLSFYGTEGCLPIWIGVDGNPDYFKAVGIPINRDARDNFIYQITAKFFDWPIYRHWFYLLMLLIAITIISILKLSSRIKIMTFVLSLAAGSFYLSFLPTTIACDFRYLYGCIPLVTILWLIVLTGNYFQSPKVLLS